MAEESGPSSSCAGSDSGFSSRHNVVKSYGISIDSSKIHEVAFEEQPESLRALGVNIFDQDVFEEGVLQQVDEAIAEQEEFLERERLNKELKSNEDELKYCNILFFYVSPAARVVKMKKNQEIGLAFQPNFFTLQFSVPEVIRCSYYT